jgi:hypothetical protein
LAGAGANVSTTLEHPGLELGNRERLLQVIPPMAVSMSAATATKASELKRASAQR